MTTEITHYPQTDGNAFKSNDKFKLEDEFLRNYADKEPDMTNLGYTVYKRTYSRELENGDTEEWWQTVQRVVEGTFTIQKRHGDDNGRSWDEDEMREKARKMYDKVFNFKFTPPGRGLWMMGTSYIFDRETSAPMFNCAFVTSKNIDEDFTQPFTYMMDMSMLGVGVGFDTKGKGKVEIKEPNVDEEWTYTIPDSREGWVDSLEVLLKGYANGEEIPDEFDYSEIREKGAKLEGFGGTASGPQPLVDLHENIHKLLEPKIGEKIDATTIVDLQNLIGKCVVAGNIRRSAQICVGDPENEDYLNLKDPDEQTEFWGEPENEHHRWAANLSVDAEIGMDYGETAKRTAKNGEPGYVWLENARECSRMGKKDMPKDNEVLGTNPCAEVVLASTEQCNLSETYPSNHSNLEEWKETLEFAYLYAKTVTMLPHHNESTNKQIKEKRRLGVSMSGIVQAFNKFGKRKMLNKMDEGYQKLQSLDENYSAKWGINESIRLTSVKPSGTVSRLADVTSGIHYPESKYYTRNIRFNEESEVLEQLKEAGYEFEKDKYSDNTTVVSFPMKKENVSRGKKEVSMWEQLENAAQVAENWADNAVSITVTYDPETEADDIEDALELYEDRLKTVSFLPAKKDVYDQAPYIPISKKDYEKNKSDLKELDLSGDTNEKIEKFCQGDSCEIDFKE